jgi:hypothetical protein
MIGGYARAGSRGGPSDDELVRRYLRSLAGAGKLHARIAEPLGCRFRGTACARLPAARSRSRAG